MINMRKRPTNICARWIMLTLLTSELRNVRYANYSPVYHSISSFDHTFEMACSTSDSSLGLFKDYAKTSYNLKLGNTASSSQSIDEIFYL